MPDTTHRLELRFRSGDTDCAAWHYPGTNGGCVVMAAGFAMPKEPGTDRFAARFQEAGFSVLAFDFRRLGGSGGGPRQTVRIGDQLTDWQAALAAAADLPEVDPARLAVWSFSATGGQVFQVARRSPRLAAAIAQTPTADGVAATRSAARHQRPGALLRLTSRGVRDALRGLLGRPPLLVPLVGRPGDVAVLTMPDALDGDRALHAERYPGWRQEVAARSTLPLSAYRPGRDAAGIRCPLLVVVAEQDQAAPPAAAVRAATAAPSGELVSVPGGHYAPFLEQHERVVQVEVDFLRRHLLAP